MTQPFQRRFRLIRLEEGETIAQQRRRQQMYDDCGAVVSCIERNPGIGSKAEIAGELGLTAERVNECIHYLNANETPFHRVDYGVNYAKSGPYAGQHHRGWWPMRMASYQGVMDDADEHSSRVILGVRWSQLDRLIYAHGLTTTAGRAVVTSVLARLDANIELMSEADYDAFVELLEEYLDANGVS